MSPLLSSSIDCFHRRPAATRICLVLVRRPAQIASAVDTLGHECALVIYQNHNFLLKFNRFHPHIAKRNNCVDLNFYVRNLAGSTLIHWVTQSVHLICNIMAGYRANTTRWPNAGLMLAQRRRRWANISPALVQRVVFAGRCPAIHHLAVLSLAVEAVCGFSYWILGYLIYTVGD